MECSTLSDISKTWIVECVAVFIELYKKNVAVSCVGGRDGIHQGVHRGGDYTHTPSLIKLDHGQI